YRSTDGAMTFSPWTLNPQPHLVGLGERVVGGQSTLYLSGKNYSDGWALATSTDEGLTVTPVMSYDQVAGIRPCVQQLCLDTCKYEETQAIWDTSVCAGPDGGLGDGGAAPTGSPGCHCTAADGGPSASRGLTGLALLAAATAREVPGDGPARDRAFRRCFASTVEDPQCRFPPSLYTAFPYKAGPIAQRSELAAHNRLVPGSNPGGPTLDSTVTSVICPDTEERIARSA